VFFLSTFTEILLWETGGNDSDDAEVSRLLGYYTVSTGKLTDVSDNHIVAIFKVQQLLDPGEEDDVILGKVGSYLSTNAARYSSRLEFPNVGMVTAVRPRTLLMSFQFTNG